MKFRIFETAVDTIGIADLDRYNTSMKKGVINKTWFLGKIMPDCIVDFGCADGSVLRHIHEQYPEIKLIGYDINPNMEARFKKNNPDLTFTSNWKEAVKMARGYSNSCLLLSSVIHEVYSYIQGGGHAISRFWNDVFGSGFKYIVIRDTIPDRIDIIRPEDYKDDVAKVKAKVDPEYVADYERKWGSIETSYRRFVMFVLTYRYKEDWDRESLENYMPLSYSTLLRKIPTTYRIIDGENYKFDPIKFNLKNQYDIELKVNTHLNMILQRS